MGDRPLIRPVTPDNAEFVLLCFEGPDQYSLAGGLGVRVAELSRALAEAGFRTHLIFVGDPHKPAVEEAVDGRLTLRRWSQWVSRYYPNGVYDGEKEKLYDYVTSVPHFVFHEICEPAVRAGRTPVIMAEEWHTASTLAAISDALHFGGLRQECVLLWNANHTMGFENVDFGRLGYTSTLTTVSHYMKHTMWIWGINPLVIPNGIPDRLLSPLDPKDVETIRKAIGGDEVLVKVGRFDPDKRWNMATDAGARLKAMGLRVKMVYRGGIEPHEGEVLHTARALGLRVQNVTAPASKGVAGWADALASAADADVINLKFFVPEELLRLLYASSDAVLANSGKEPFGIVGLEVMATGGIAVTGATGEEYARGFENAVVLETDDPNEIVTALAYLREHPQEAAKMRAAARETAAKYTWARVVDLLCRRVQFLVTSQALARGRR